jgi:hypothetical protein
MSEGLDNTLLDVSKLQILYNKKSLTPSETSEFINQSFAFITMYFKIGYIDGEERIFLLNIKDKLNSIATSDIIKPNKKGMDKIHAFNRIAVNNLHLIGGKKRRRTKKRQGLRKKRNGKRYKSFRR